MVQPLSFSPFQENTKGCKNKVIQQDDDFILKHLFSHCLIIYTPKINCTLRDTFPVSLTPLKLYFKKA